MDTTGLRKKLPAKTIRDFMLLGIIVVLVFWLLAPDDKRLLYPVSIDSLKGVWTTTHPQYKDRFLQFSNDTITFGWGDAGAGSYMMNALDSEPAQNSMLVQLRYWDMEATDYQFSFHYAFQNGGIIWMENQKPVYWRRTSTEPTYDPVYK
jgi:hypothetical protein